MTESGHAVEETKEQLEREGQRADNIFNVVFFGVLGVLFVLSILSWTLWGYRVEDIGVSQLLFVNGVILIAAIVVGMAGFGMAQVANGLLPLYISASVGNIMFTPLAFVSVGRTFWSVRQHFRWKNTLFPVLGLIPSLPAGTYFFARIADVGPVWFTEYKEHEAKNRGVELVEVGREYDQQDKITYYLAPLRAAPHPDLARKFVDFVLSPAGQETYERYGFVPSSKQAAG